MSGHSEVLVDMAEAILRTAVDVLEATGRGAPARARFTSGEPAEFCCGSVTVIYRRQSPIVPPAASGSRPLGPGSCDPFLWTTDWTLDLSRECPPQLGSVYNIVPSPAAERDWDHLQLLDAATLSQDFAPQVQKAATAAVRQAGFVQMTCVSFRPGLITPYTTSGDCVGHRFDFTLGLSA